VRLWGVEAAGEGIGSGRTAAAITAGSVGVLHGSRSYLLQTEHGQVIETHSISAGLDYPGVGPEHAYLKASGRATYVPVTDEEALDAFFAFSKSEGIIPALESAHAIAFAGKLAQERGPDDFILVNLSGRGDKDIAQVRDMDKNESSP
jgi:tryptophan synthase beta chain